VYLSFFDSYFILVSASGPSLSCTTFNHIKYFKGTGMSSPFLTAGLAITLLATGTTAARGQAAQPLATDPMVCKTTMTFPPSDTFIAGAVSSATVSHDKGELVVNGTQTQPGKPPVKMDGRHPAPVSAAVPFPVITALIMGAEASAQPPLNATIDITCATPQGPRRVRIAPLPPAHPLKN
jgi:hypothetical protein